MAKVQKSISFRNSTIDNESMTITEINKDDEKTYDLKKILKDWSGIEGLSFSIKQDEELPSEFNG